jgi:hypothetical protein
MDAEKVFALWRRVLRDDAMREAVFGEPPATGGTVRLSPEDSAIAAVLAPHREAAYWPLHGYRFRLVHMLTSDLCTHASTTLGVLEAFGRDPRVLTRRFLEHVGWRDYGWYIGEACRDFFAFLAEELGDSINGLSDVLALETTRLALLARLAEVPPASWAGRGENRLDETTHYCQSPAAAGITLDHDVSRWLAAPESAREQAPERGPFHVVVYLTSLDEPPMYAALGDREKKLFDMMATPLTLAEASARFGDRDGSRSTRAALTGLLDLGIVRSA